MSNLYPNLVHITCVSHMISRVLCQVGEGSELEKLVLKILKVFKSGVTENSWRNNNGKKLGTIQNLVKHGGVRGCKQLNIIRKAVVT